ncbi:MAG: hypothetical protein CMD16_00895 [Flavobacteriales bacterium]|nr:hypothetical protein [Flavobacteriales bacterium]|tara:strand:- start:23867 stop:24337 length:471 start_codon:yes stop_codon:yes gene_type:complete
MQKNNEVMHYLFEENQKFRQWWLWLILLFSLITPMIFFDNNPVGYNYVLMILLILLLFFLLELRIKINPEGLYYQFFPFHLKVYMIKAKQIKNIETVQYSPFDQGGWGIKYGFQGKSYTVSGNKGLKIFLSNGRTIIFGSQRYKEMEKALRKIKKQ